MIMVGGNIPGETQVASIAIFNHVETLNYTAAHQLSAILVGSAFVLLLAVFALNGTTRVMRLLP
jgi:molybdate transport system permease protein